MKTATFTSGGDTLTVTLTRGRKSLKVQVRHQEPEKKGRVGCKDYFEVDADGEQKAQAAFDKLLADANAQGWTLSGQTTKAVASRGFTAIPAAPTKTAASASATPAPAAARAASGRR